ncbi:ABC transporter ATP-binding protein, putative [Babesia ovata]|uniref:ABC transporter ATP-binding protein, putative n=1 Tax=Babesia ovata TaxID=189622 RepID=A0A2H6KAM7_9APIC|nr:ABC transporter ATP-binding protein, putative [Babesia ovata]GBE60051.1 ABC transporter ATP-binding protein, putative [Babesia ovata]
MAWNSSKSITPSLRNTTGIVRIEQLEGLLQPLLLHEVAAVHGHGEELAVVDEAVFVEIDVLQNLVDLFFHLQYLDVVQRRALEVQVLREAPDELVAVELPVAVRVHPAENGGQVVALLLRNELGAYVEQRGLRQLLRIVEALHVVDGELQAGEVHAVIPGHVGEPVVLERLVRADALGGVVRNHARDEVLRTLRHLAPLRQVEGVLAGLHLLDDLGLIRAVEGRETAQQNVQDHTNRPYVALAVVHALEHVWRDVVRGADLVLHLRVQVAVRGETEVDDPDVGIGVLGLKQQVLGLEVAVHDVLLVHVVDTAEHLLDNLRGVLLGEALSVDNFVEQFAAGVQLRDEVVVLLVLVELEDLHDVRVVQRLEHVHLAQKRLVVALALHRALQNHLHGVLLSGLAVEAQQYLAERPLSEKFDGLVVVTKRSIGTGDEHARGGLQRAGTYLRGTDTVASLRGRSLGITAQSGEFFSHSVVPPGKRYAKTHLGGAPGDPRRCS